MGHNWENALHLENITNFKMGQSLKNVSHVEKWFTLGKNGITWKMGYTWKNGSSLTKRSDILKNRSQVKKKNE